MGLKSALWVPLFDELADPGLVRRVAAYWYDALTGTTLGRGLLHAILTAPSPCGTTPVDGVPVAADAVVEHPVAALARLCPIP